MTASETVGATGTANSESTARKLDLTERKTLAAVVKRVIPSDDGVGAVETGCPDYVIQAVENRFLTANIGKIKRGLEFTEKLSRQIFGKSFSEAESDEQDQVLTQLQRMPHPTLQLFFHRLISLSLEGFLCDPRHGGNQDRAGWKYLGLDADTASENESCTTS